MGTDMANKKKETKPTTKHERHWAEIRDIRLEPMGNVGININSKHDAINETLAADKSTPNGFLPEHIRNLLRAAIAKTD